MVSFYKSREKGDKTNYDKTKCPRIPARAIRAVFQTYASA